MKGLEKTKVFLENPDDVIKFYNSSAESFYRGSFVFVDNRQDFTNKFKSDLLYFLVETERVIKATFNTSLGLYNADLELFKKMFPNITENIFNINCEKDLIAFGSFLKTVRNINAHSICSLEDFRIFKSDFSSLKKQKNLNPNVKYLTDDDKLTLAGFIFIIVNLGRAQSIKSITTKNKDIGLITSGVSGIDDGESFVKEVSHVDWEIKIREANERTLEGAVFGNLLEKAKTDDPLCFELLVGGEDSYYEHKYYANIGQNRIYVHKNTLSDVLYEEDFDLRISDTKHFIELSNQYPPFLFVDLLYKLNISIFDENAYMHIVDANNWWLYSKPMYAKFYVDKNLDILLADKSKSDLRISSNVCNGALHAIFMKLEKLIIKYYRISLKNIKYSKLSDLLRRISADNTLIKKAQIIRNFVSHGYNFGEHFYVDGQIVKHDLENSIELMIGLIDFFEKQNELISYALKRDIARLLINQMLSIKDKLFVKESITFIRSYPNITNIDELKKKERFFNNSSISPSIFAELNKRTGGDLRCILIKSEKLGVNLMLVNNNDGRNYLKFLLLKTGLLIAEETDDGVLKYVTLK